MGFPQLLIWAIPIFVLAMLCEYRVSKGMRFQLYSPKDYASNIVIGLVELMFSTIVSAYKISLYYICFEYFSALRYQYLGYEDIGWSAFAWVAGVLLDDLTFYWFHRSSHSIRIFWAIHCVHHSSEYYNFSTGFRNSWMTVFYKPLFWCGMAIVGFHPLMILTCMSMNLLYQFFCHTLTLPRFDKLAGILNTPALHAIHHGKEDHCIDKNFAGVFIFIDRFFGTYQSVDPSKKITFGIKNAPRSGHIDEVYFHEFREIFKNIKSSKSWGLKLKHLFFSPGWSKENMHL